MFQTLKNGPLQSYYNILDRALKLEQKSSNMDVHKLKSEDVIDFETWRSMRGKEKAKDELNMLLSREEVLSEYQYVKKPLS